MTKPLLFLATVVFLFIKPDLAFAKDGYKRNPDIDILHYCFHVSLNDSTDYIDGQTDITMRLSGTGRTLILDLKGTGNNGKGMVISKVETPWKGMVAGKVATADKGLSFKHENDRISIAIPDTVTIPGTFTLSVFYSGLPNDGLIISKNKFGDRTFFGDNWPDRARNWLPVIDHPSDKATVEFIVSAPDKYQVVSNGYLAGTYDFIDPRGNLIKVTTWREDVPIPTKVMVIGAADFAWTTAGLSKGIPVRTWVYSKNREAGYIDYEPAASILTFYQDLVGPYSYEKLANVQSKTMFGGMENSGCIFYYEGSVSGKNHLHSLLAHEIAHQWFGDAVTENDWHHIWLSEGFATYLEACYADSMIPGRNLDVSMADMRKDVIRYYVKTHKPVIDTTITDNMALLSTNSYQKGAWVLHMLRQELGDEVFWTGIREFYATYRDKNAMTSDFQSVMERISGRDLGLFFHQWLEVAGQPEIQWSWIYNKKKSRVEIDVEQTQTQGVFTFTLPVEILGTPSLNADSEPIRSKFEKVLIKESKVHLTLPVDFPVAGIRLDPKNQLLFQEKLIKN